jgi:succinate dehydrogenase / fumarate reductase flavoprotein subunit
VVLATGGIGKSFKVTSNSWEYTGDGHALALRAGATLINMEFVQFHPTGMVWPPSVKGILVTESVRGDGGVLRNSDGKRFMFDYIPDVFRKQYARPRRRPTAGTPTRTTTGARPSCCPATRSPARSTPRSRPAAAHRTAASSSTSPPAAGRGDPQAAAVDVPPVQGAGRRRHHQGADGGRPDLPLRDGRRRGRPGHRGGVAGARACSRPARCPAACTAPTGSAATRCPTCWCSASGPASTRRPYVRRRWAEAARGSTVRGRGGGDEALAPFEGPGENGGENPYTLHQDLQQTMNDLVGIIRREGELSRRWRSSRSSRSGPERRRRGPPAVQPGLAPRPRPAQHAAGLASAWREGGAGAQESAAGTPARTSRMDPSGAGQPGLRSTTATATCGPGPASR